MHITRIPVPISSQIISRGDPLDANVWYTATLHNLSSGTGSQGVRLEINNQPVLLTLGEFAGINFDVFNGPLYVGGHPSLDMIQVYIIGCNGVTDIMYIHI